MTEIGQYLLSIVAAAIIVSIANTFTEKKGFIGSILNLISGLVLAAIIVSPWTDFRFSDPESLYTSAETDGANLVQQIQLETNAEISEHIKTEAEAYILDKASALGLNISADIALTSESPPAIKSITITGDVSPYAKQRLIQIICELGIKEDSITWS